MHTVNVVRALEYSDVKDTLISAPGNITSRMKFSYHTKIIFTLYKLPVLSMTMYMIRYLLRNRYLKDYIQILAAKSTSCTNIQKNNWQHKKYFTSLCRASRMSKGITNNNLVSC